MRSAYGLAPSLMVQGTSSSVGKSVLVTALCRIFASAGYRVAPFKSQNMALNSAVTVDGGEIGRAQAVQAEAAGVEPTVDMNPILLKPEEDARCQVVVRGRPVGSFHFSEYNRMKPDLLPVIRESLELLRGAYDLVLIEGAGSPAEVNLKADEIVNMRVARLAESPVLLVGDIDRGGVFAALVGTLELLEPTERAAVQGLVINKFRGDPALLTTGLEFLMRRTGVPVLGVLPYCSDLQVPAEDSMSLDGGCWQGRGEGWLDIVVIRLPRIANFDDFEPLAQERGVRLRFIRHAHELNGADAIILPGTKSTVTDLEFLQQNGLARLICARAASGTPVLGICGGYQMLGQEIRDPKGVESDRMRVPGLGLLPVVTEFSPLKTTQRVSARVTARVGLFATVAGSMVQGYEIHMGQSRIIEVPSPCSEPLEGPFTITERQGVATEERDGAMDQTGNIVGTYLHGLFRNGPVRRTFLTYLADRKGVAPDPGWGTCSSVEATYDGLARLVASHLDMARIAKLVNLPL
ncbi:Cobyric acid synthase [Candidatus Methylomirabilis lanthanidiphila]|uniref:Cobyric acid synthase n=1 Tax=Candidatus Methylomirabilis lanthanidiphila TaxID=2211376 RepID=A0A564ZI14_9BACT|nr:Cobyric acid synthase [Candidatus Methylomirabilis lanthanidiphila]